MNMRVKILAAAAALLLATTIKTGATEAAPDTVRAPHVLQALEVIGIKQSAGADGAEAVTRISGSQARALGVESPHDIGLITPNVYMPDYGSRMTSTIYVRGLGARMDQPVMGLSVDNVPYLNKDTYDFDIADIETIEVLRGAQAVLNGRNTMGGQINIRTLSPLTAGGLRVRAGYGNGNTFTGGASYYGRLSEALGMSVSADYHHTDGFFRNLYNGRRLDRENSGSLRWKTHWRPTAALSFNNTASLSLTGQGGYPYESLASGMIAYNDTCSYRRTFFADGLSVAWAGKRVVVTSVTSVQYLDDDMRLDQDFLPDDYFTLRQKRKEWTVTEDLFARGRRGKYSWLGGVFAFYKTTDMDAPVTFKDTGIARLIEQHRNDVNPAYPISWDSRSFTLGSNFTLRSAGVAVYQQSTWRLDDWRFELGLRLDYERPSIDYVSSCNTGFTTWHVLPDGTRESYMHTPVVINDGEGLSKHFLEFLPQLTVAWDNPSFAPYFNFSKAYKTGGYNTQMFSDVLQQRIMSTMGISAQYSLADIVQYNPERSYNYEVGFHSSLPRLNLKLDGVGFFIDCRDQQLTTFPAGNTTGRIMTNAGRTHSFGAELTATWTPTSDLRLSASYGYTNARFRRYNDGIADYKGKRVPYAPENTLFAEVDWRASSLAFAGITPTANINVRGAGKIYWNENNTEHQDFYATLGASILLSARKWSVRLWGRNLTNTHYSTFYFVSIGNSFTQRALPRTFGATLRLSL